MDYVVLLGETIDKLQLMLEKLQKTAESMGLKMNDDKTKAGYAAYKTEMNVLLTLHIMTLNG